MGCTPKSETAHQTATFEVVVGEDNWDYFQTNTGNF